MSMIYVLISKEISNVLCEYTDFKGNFEQISRSLLKKVKANKRATFSYEESLIPYLDTTFITLIRMTLL